MENGFAELRVSKYLTRFRYRYEKNFGQK